MSCNWRKFIVINSVSKVWRQTDANFKIRRMRTGKGTSIVNKTGGDRVVSISVATTLAIDGSGGVVSFLHFFHIFNWRKSQVRIVNSPSISSPEKRREEREERAELLKQSRRDSLTGLDDRSFEKELKSTISSTVDQISLLTIFN